VCLDADGEVLTVHSVALCRNGAVEGMEFKEVALSVSVPCAAPEPTEDNMDWKKIGKRLGLPDTATEAEVKAKYEKWLAENPEPATPPKAEEKGKGDEKDAAGKDGKKPAALNVAGTPYTEEFFDKLEAEMEKRRLRKLAASQGKVVGLSDEAVAAMKPADFEVYVAGLGVTVPLNAKTPQNLAAKPLDGGAEGLSAEELKIYAACGVEPPKPADGKKE